MNWTPTELDVVHTLTCRIRVLTVPLIARAWWPEPGESASTPAQAIARLVGAGLLDRYLANVHPPLAPKAPVIGWSPGQAAPDFRAASGKLKSRWSQAPEPTELFTASPLAANLFGSASRRLPDPLHRDHDLLLAEVFVHYRTHDPPSAEAWVGESALPKAGYRIKDPDAFLMRGGRPCRIVESGGRYNHRQLESLHQYAQARELPYEVW